MIHYADLDRAGVHYKCALKFDPSFGGTYFNYATQLINQRKPDQALHVLQKAQTVQGIDQSMLLEMIGQAHELKKNYRSALESYRASLANTVDNWQSETLLSHIKRVRKKRWLFRSFF